MNWSSRKPFLQLIAFMFLIAIMGRKYWFHVIVSYIMFSVITSKLSYRIFCTLPRDLSGLYLLFRVKMNIRKRLKEDIPLHEIFLENVYKYPKKDAIVEVESGQRLSFEELNHICNQYAHFFKTEGYGKGDVASIFLENGIDFVALWLGLSKIGVITAWINSHLKMEPLAYSVNAAKSKSVITSRSLLPTLEDVFERRLLSRCKVYLVDDDIRPENGIVPLKVKVKHCTMNEPISDGVINFQSALCYIYTSGTTGNPKPAVIKHFRYYFFAMGAGKAFEITPKDRFYITMPMYHSAAGILGIGQMIHQGCTVVIRRKFSASNFWKDCVKYDCTVSQYIGEICRYLLAQKVVPEENLHKVRLMFGNGLRSEIWPEFVSRFNIQKIGEVYGSTEGNSNIVNIDNRVGACGFFPIYPYLTKLYPIRLLKIDEETGELLRNKNGFCIPCVPGETGEMVGIIKEKDILLRFEGYVNSDDTNSKIIRNALCKGDALFRSGDVMHWDEYGYLYFRDRCGDTFRWKGENVSTTEVEGILQPIKAVVDVTVYGVEIPRKEGRAGMAAVVLDHNFAVEDIIGELTNRLCSHLPAYAVPVFIRFCKKVDRTGTFKLKKINLQKEGFDIRRCNGDSVYYFDHDSKTYKRMDTEMQHSIENGSYDRM